MNKQLIFDIGFHKGEDTRYYLYKGYNVVAVDAAENLIMEGKNMFQKEVESGQLILEHSVVSSHDNKISSFYISPNSLWSSEHKDVAERKGLTSKQIFVPSCTLRSLIHKYGVPYYCKIDIEGNDIIALESLKDNVDLPHYISVETECLGDNSQPNDVMFSTLDMLYELGYRKFKLVDQTTLSVLGIAPFYCKEATSMHYKDSNEYAKNILKEEGCFQNFFPNSSGPFGKDLRGIWSDYESAKSLIKFHSKAQRKLGLEVWSFWCDWHATF